MYFDDAIASHVEQVVLDELGFQMQAGFGEMDIISGTEHSFLGMNIEINEEEKTIKIDMKDQITNLIKKFEEDSGESIVISVTTPAIHN